MVGIGKYQNSFLVFHEIICRMHTFQATKTFRFSSNSLFFTRLVLLIVSVLQKFNIHFNSLIQLLVHHVRDFI